MATERYVVASEGMTLSRIVWNRYHGSGSGVVEQTLAANRHLASLPAELPVGTVIDIPVVTSAATSEATVSLWD
jgi:phage tail protein X